MSYPGYVTRCPVCGGEVVRIFLVDGESEFVCLGCGEIVQPTKKALVWRNVKDFFGVVAVVGLFPLVGYLEYLLP